MSGPVEPGPLKSADSVFDYALRLHRQDPDSDLPDDGAYPAASVPRRRPRSRDRNDWRTGGADVAAILDRYFADSSAAPSQLVDAFGEVDVPIHRNEHIAAAALRADRKRVRRTGRWLVRHSTDKDAAVVGLALLATDIAEEDIPLIRTIGLLSTTFGPLAAHALRRRRGGSEALLWLAQRVSGWGRVCVVEALCESGSTQARPWLLRHACDGDYLNGYFAGKVATAAYLHEAITAPDADDALVDHTGLLLATMADCGGMGMTLENYPPAPAVLQAHASHLLRRPPAAQRYVNAAVIANYLDSKTPQEMGCTTDQQQLVLQQYRSILHHADWRQAAHAGLAPDGHFFTWFSTTADGQPRPRRETGDDGAG